MVAKLKTCINCKQELPKTSEYFYYRNKKRGWLNSWCKRCRVERRKETKDRELETQRIRRGNMPAKSAAEKKLITPVCVICGTEDKTGQAKTCKSCAPIRRRNEKRDDKAIYKSRLRKARPAWANLFFLREAYRLARLRTKTTGIEWHVDHIIPIRGKHVSGLHTHENLRVILGITNMRKGNEVIDANTR